MNFIIFLYVDDRFYFIKYVVILNFISLMQIKYSLLLLRAVTSLKNEQNVNLKKNFKTWKLYFQKLTIFFEFMWVL